MRSMNASIPNPAGTSTVDGAPRARFEAVRQRVFSEMTKMASRWRYALVVPFHALVIVILASRGFPLNRLAIQVAASATILLSFGFSERSPARQSRKLLMLGGLAILTSIANTGGLASPLIMSLVPFFASIAMNPFLENRRRHFVVKFVVLFGIMAWFSRACALPAPLGMSGEAGNLFATREYVAIAFASAVVSLLAVYHIGKAVTGAYERITLELAERREELCDENEGRTRALEGIAARLAHEVKNPLAAIKGLSTHMARSSEDPKVKERLTIVAAEAERLQEIVDGFLSFSRGLDELTVAATKPYDIAHELALLLETRAADAGVAIEVRGSRELTLDADSKKLRQALLNLVLNAMQASARGSTVTLEVAKSCADGAAVLRIIDRGSGMTPDVLERIRKPYFTTKEGGSGLGIAIARGIIEQHGGTLRLESTAGRGTTAIVTLPACVTQHGRMLLPNPCRKMAESFKDRVKTVTAEPEVSPVPAEKVPS
jgi:signal transduction histidine kinase